MREAHVHICLPASDLSARASHLERFVTDLATATSRAQPHQVARAAVDEAWAAHRAGHPLLGPQLTAWAAQAGGAHGVLSYALLRVDPLPAIYGAGCGELVIGVNEALDLGVRLSSRRPIDRLVACGAHSRLILRSTGASSAQLVDDRVLELGLRAAGAEQAVAALMAGPGRRPLVAGWSVRVLPG